MVGYGEELTRGAEGAEGADGEGASGEAAVAGGWWLGKAMKDEV
jgi:hypothetical protein